MGSGGWGLHQIVLTSNRLRVKLSLRQVGRVKFVHVKLHASNCHVLFRGGQLVARGPFLFGHSSSNYM